MRKVLISTLVSLACVAPATAQEAAKPVDAPAMQNQAAVAPSPDQQSQSAQAAQQQVKEPAQLVEDALRTQLSRAGFTDIELLPTSFLIRAKNADGNAVMLVLSTDSAKGIQMAPQGDDEDEGIDDTPSRQEGF